MEEESKKPLWWYLQDETGAREFPRFAVMGNPKIVAHLRMMGVRLPTVPVSGKVYSLDPHGDMAKKAYADLMGGVNEMEERELSYIKHRRAGTLAAMMELSRVINSPIAGNEKPKQKNRYGFLEGLKPHNRR